MNSTSLDHNSTSIRRRHLSAKGNADGLPSSLGELNWSLS